MKGTETLEKTTKISDENYWKPFLKERFLYQITLDDDDDYEDDEDEDLEKDDEDDKKNKKSRKWLLNLENISI